MKSEILKVAEELIALDKCELVALQNLNEEVLEKAEKCIHHPCMNGGFPYCDYPECDMFET